MSPSVKNFFHIQRSDQRAITILLITIAILGIAFFATRSSWKTGNLATIEDNASFEAFLEETRKLTELHPPKLSIGETININLADTTSLKRIPGIGPAIATRIVEYRTRNGDFSSTEELKKIRGIGNNLYDRIMPYIAIETEEMSE